MKINIISDMHIEFGAFEHTPKDCDVVIIAGDISGNNKGSAKWVKENYKEFDKPVIWISGNHEFYAGKEMSKSYKLAKELSDESSNIHFLQNDMVEIGDVIFIGSTLWTDFKYDKNPDFSKDKAHGLMNDYKCIKYFDGKSYRKLRPSDTEREFYKNFKYIKKVVAENKDKKIVIVTHHAPTGKSIAPQFQTQKTNPAYVSDLSEFILDNPQISVWAHGHTHVNCRYDVGDTRVVCNPRGYWSYNENPAFDPDFIVEV